MNINNNNNNTANMNGMANIITNNHMANISYDSPLAANPSAILQMHSPSQQTMTMSPPTHGYNTLNTVSPQGSVGATSMRSDTKIIRHSKNTLKKYKFKSQ